MARNNYNGDQPDNISEQISQSAESGIKKGAKQIGKGLFNKGKSLLKKAGKKAASESTAVALKLMLKKYGLIALGILAGIILLMVLFMAMGDALIEERGTTENYSLEVDEVNVSGINEDGVRNVIALTEPQALKTAYYRLMSCCSFKKIIPDGDTEKEFVFYDPLKTSDENNKEESEKNRQDFAGLQDYYENEKNFLLSPDFIMMADEHLHDYLVYYPEQIIKSVYHTKTRDDKNNIVLKTEEIYDSAANSLKPDVVSKGYDKVAGTESKYENKDNGTDEVGVWDYGMGSVLSYQCGTKKVWHTYHKNGYDTCEHSIDPETGEIIHTLVHHEADEDVTMDKIPLKGAKDIEIGQREYQDETLNNQFGNNGTTIYPIKIPLITSAALFSGSVNFKYEVREEQTPFSDGTGTQLTDSCHKILTGVCGEHGEIKLYEYRDSGVVHTEMEQQIEEEKDVLGFDYIDQYYKNYFNYVPFGLKNDLDFETRTENHYKILTDLGLLKPYTGESSSNGGMGGIGGTGGTGGTGSSGGGVILPPADVDSVTGSNGEMNDTGGTHWSNWNNLTMMAHLIAAEAAGNKLDKLLVGAVAFNRWKGGTFGPNLFDVISAKNQYACFNPVDGGHWASFQPTEMDIESAKQVISGEFTLPSNVVFQSQSILGTIFMESAPHYYCVKAGDPISSTDVFGRPALSPDQLRTRAAQLDGSGSMAENIGSAGDGSDSQNVQIGGTQTVEVTYYCDACNDPPGTDNIAWADGPTHGHAKAGETCAMSKGSMAMLGVKYGDWINIEGVGQRRVEDLCGAGYGGTIKTDRIVIDVYVESENGTCTCSNKPSNTHAQAYKVNGSGSTTPVGYYGKSTGLYYCDISNPNNFDLYSAEPFDTYALTNSFQKLSDPDKKWYESLIDEVKNLLNSALDLVKSIFTAVFFEDVFDGYRFYAVPPSSVEKTHDVVYQALAINQNRLYSDVVGDFDENNMDLIFVGNAPGSSMFNSGFGLVNGVGSSVEGFVSPTGTYYQPSNQFSTTNETVTMATPAGTSVQAVYSGKVQNLDFENGSVTVEHKKDGKTYTITYSNIDLSLNPDTYHVSKEQVLGTSKEGGLKLSVYVDGKYVDPMTVFYQSTYSYDATGLVQKAKEEIQKYGANGRYGMRYKQYYMDHGYFNYLLSKDTAWCTLFVGTCAKEIGLCDADLYPWANSSMCVDVVQWFKNKGRWIDGSSGYAPKPGDIVLFDWDGDGRAQHIGIVEYYDGTKIHTLEGNTKINGVSSMMGARSRSYGSYVLGFGIIGN